MPFTSDADTFYEERSQFFMVLALVSLAPKLEAVCNKILSSSAIPSYDMVSEQLLCLFTMHAFGSSSAPVEDSFALVSHSSNCGGWGKGRGGQPCFKRCNYCSIYGHIEANCRNKARDQAKSVNMAQVAFPTQSAVASLALPANVTIFVAEYNELIQLRAT